MIRANHVKRMEQVFDELLECGPGRRKRFIDVLEFCLIGRERLAFQIRRIAIYR